MAAMLAPALSSPGGPLARLAPLDRAIIEAVAYADVFDYPLTRAELRQNLQVVASVEEVDWHLSASAPLLVALAQDEGLVMLAGREHLVSVRTARSVSSARLWPSARMFGAMIGRLPFVRMVAVTGALAVDNSGHGDDLDYLVVTRTGRVWLTRALIMAVVRLARLRGVTLCPNFILDETALALRERSIYAARELAQMVPLWGAEAYGRMLAANAWYRDVLPNATPARDAAAGEPGTLKRAVERALGGAAGDRLEQRVFASKGAELRRAAAGHAEAEFTASICKGHFDGHSGRTGVALAERLRRVEESLS